MKKKAKGKSTLPFTRRWARRFALATAGGTAVLCLLGSWYARHPLDWLESSALPRPLARTLLFFGDRTLMMTDALGWTGHDAVYESDDPAPAGRIDFAGLPRRTGFPAPTDIRVLTRGEFVLGWSDALGHPYWAAYHVPAEAKHTIGKRPSFRKDRALATGPAASAYDRTGYDRGHLAPNHAITTRFGPEAQSRTFLMSNVAPQRPALNRGPWRELERRIADLWTARWGEIWVLCGTIPAAHGGARETLSGTRIEVPEKYWMLSVAQEGQDVRALAVVLPQTVGYDDFPTHRLVTIDSLEEMTGLDLLPDLPGYLQTALEADLPTRLWPIRLRDTLALIFLRFPQL